MRAIYLLVMAVLVVAYYVVPRWRPGTVGLIGLVAAGAIAVGVARVRPQRWPGWVAVAVAVVLLGVGDVAFTVMADLTPGPVRYPGVADAFYVIAYVPLTLGLLWLGRPQLPSRDWPLLLDAVALSLAGSLLVWITLVRPAVTSLHLDGVGRVVAVASWVGYVAVLAAAARVLVAWRTNAALTLLAAGVSAFLVADFFYGRELIAGTWNTGSLIDLGFLAFSVLCGAAALQPSMRRIASASYARHELGPLRLTILTVAMLEAPTVLLVETSSGRVTTGVAIAVVTAAVGVVLLVRLSLSAQAYRSRAGREHAVRMASRAFVLATTESEVVTGLQDAVTAMLPARAHGQVRLLPAVDAPHDGVSVLVGPTRGSPQPGELVVAVNEAGPPVAGHEPAKDGGPVLVFQAPVGELVELTPLLEALADQASSALHRIWLADRLSAEERERYFRALVHNSDDVILIDRGGRVDYVTPSGSAMFGRDVTGEPVHRVRPAASVHHSDGQTAGGNEWEGHVDHPDGGLTVLVRRRDLRHDPAVAGVVYTLRDVTAERALQRELAYRATHDPLTGLANAQLFSQQQDTFADTTQPGGRAALFLDVDDFKTVNDSYGHEFGDRLLTVIAHRIQTCLRPDDLAARIGGDEFAVLLSGLSHADTARAITQRLTDRLAQPITLDTVTVDCRASIGLAYTDGPVHLDSLLREADTALYTAKAHGKGRWRQYQEGMSAPIRRNLHDRRRIQTALTNSTLAVYYQPIIELATDAVVGFEALIRLRDNDPPITPREVIAVAEDTGLITAVGDHVLRHALAAVPLLNSPDNGRPRYVSVNISARQLQHDSFLTAVRAALAATATDPTMLVLEITESHLVTDDHAWKLLAQLRHDGIRIAIDDYGTGYSSLDYLRRPGVDIIKTDQSFLTHPTPRTRILLEAVTNLCQRLHLTQIAEGVQDEAGKQTLLTLGCPYGQGFLYAPAMPLTQAAHWPPP